MSSAMQKPAVSKWHAWSTRSVDRMIRTEATDSESICCAVERRRSHFRAFAYPPDGSDVALGSFDSEAKAMAAADAAWNDWRPPITDGQLLVFYKRMAIAAEARLAALVYTPIVTMDGAAVHIVSLIDDDGEALTRCGLRIERALSLIDVARKLHGAKDCRSCRRYLRDNP